MTLDHLPDAPTPHRALLSTMDELRSKDADWRAGRCFALVYDGGDAHNAFLKQAHNAFFSENGLNPMAFQSVRKMEADVVRMAANLFNGDDEVVGTMTTGGTESLLLVVKAARDKAKKERRLVTAPEMILPTSAHVALDKAAHYFGVKVRWAPMRDDFRVDVDAVRRLINRNTILIVGSAPQYPHGVIDPIAELAALAKKKKIPMHVDACVGGFLLPFLPDAGLAVKPWDFRVDGVTSISADLHKFGYTAKGASVLLYKDMDHLKHQFFISTDWPGGVYASPTIPGTRVAGSIAAAWAGLQAIGRTGYVAHAKRAKAACDTIKDGVASISGLCLFGSTDATIIAIGCSDASLDAFAIGDALHQKGWHFDRVQNPSGIHLTVMAAHDKIAAEFVSDLRNAAEHVRKHPELRNSGAAATYGMMAKIPFRFLVKDAAEKFMTQLYSRSGEVPSVEDAKSGGIIDRIVAKYGAEIQAGLDAIDRAKQKARALRKRTGSR
jgi:sphinganine-1-phosphate aldolase